MVSTKPAVQFNYYCCRVSNLFLANGAALWVSRSPLGYKKHHSHSPPWELWFAIKPNRERPGHSLSIGLLDLVRSDQGKLRDQVVWVSHLVVVSRLIGWAWIHVCCLVWTDLAILQKPYHWALFIALERTSGSAPFVSLVEGCNSFFVTASAAYAFLS